jgi:carbamoyl-phosphate synthase large subunit
LAPEVLKRSEGKKKVIILGSGPNRIGQGIEFDYCCVHGVLSLRENGIEAVIINCNPETVSTDYDISDRLYFEPLTLESVLEIVHREEQNGELLGVVVQFGGQTPLKLTAALEAAKVPILGSPHAAIELAEDRELFSKTVSSLNLKQPPFGLARSIDEAIKVASNLQFPLMIRPSYVLGGRSMRVLYSLREVEQYLLESVSVSESRPVLLDRFLENGVEVDVDLLADGEEVVVAGVMEHIERAGIHSGDSSCAIPPHTLSAAITTELERQGKLLAKALKVVGLLNVQFAVVGNEPYILEANPRASRTLPFISKATGVPWAKRAMEVMLGKKLTELDLGRCSYRELEFSAVKASVFPFSKFHEEDPVLGPEMRSTGEVMGISSNFPESYAKSQLASGINLPLSGRVFFSVRDSDKNHELLKIAKDFLALNFELTATAGTSLWLKEHGISTTLVKKVREGSPHIVDVLGEGKISLVINTPEGSGSTLDSSSIRIVARELKVPCYTTLAAAGAAASGIAALKNGKSVSVRSLQEWNI